MEINSRKENLKAEIPHREQQIEILADILQSVRLVMILGMFTSNIYDNVIEFIAECPSTFPVCIWPHINRKIVSSPTSD